MANYLAVWLWQYLLGSFVSFLDTLSEREKRTKHTLNKHVDLNSSCTDLLHNYKCAHAVPDVSKRV